MAKPARKRKKWDHDNVRLCANYSPLPKCRSCELIENARVAGSVVLLAVSFTPHPEVIEVHVVPAYDPGQELVERDMLGDRGHDASTFKVESLITPVRIDTLKQT